MPSQKLPNSPQGDVSDSHSSSGGPRFHCDQCTSTFQRSEHLKRHQRTHSAENRPFVCSVCYKGFSRSDTLNRHLLIHNYPYGGVASSVDGGSWLNPSGNRACHECAKARAKCSKGQVCSRCIARSLSCVYPTRRKRRRRADESTEGDASGEEIHLEQEATPGPSVTTPVMAQEPEAFQLPDTDAESLAHVEHRAVPPRVRTQPARPKIHTIMSTPDLYGHIQLGNAMNGGNVVRSTDASRYLASGTVTGLPPTPGPPPQSPFGFETDVGGPPSAFSMPYNSQAYEIGYNAPLNWLPPNFEANIDYTSILGFDLIPFQQFPDAQHGVNEISPLSSLAPSVGVNSGFQQQEFVDRYTARQSGVRPEPRAPCKIASPAQIPSQSTGSIHSMLADSTNGVFYATSTDGARLPSTVRFKRPPIAVYGAQPIPSKWNTRALDDCQSALGFPDLSSIIIDGFSGKSSTATLILPSTYNHVYDAFARICLASDPSWPAFANNNFPLIGHLNYFAYLYFERFHPVFPILHKATLDLNEYWPLALAVAALGCQYTNTKEFSLSIVPMQEFLRRVVTLQLERNDWTSIALIQTATLSQIGMLYSASRNLVRRARGGHGKLVDICRQLCLLSPSPKGKTASGGTQRARTSIPSGSSTMLSAATSAAQSDWDTWIGGESRRRLGYGIWLLDCMRYYQFDFDTSLTLAEAKAALPHDILWEAGSASQWLSLHEQHIENPSLFSAVQTIYHSAKVKHDIGEFSRVILLHGIYRETWDVSKHYSRPLAFWQSSVGMGLRQDQASNLTPNDSAAHPQANNTYLEPSTTASNRNTTTGTVTQPADPPHRWLPEVTPFLNWRNATCDSVDVLHWAANATIAYQSGVEHPTVFHLHLARTILLVPWAEIRTLALSIAANATSTRPTTTSPTPTASSSSNNSRSQTDSGRQRPSAAPTRAFLVPDPSLQDAREAKHSVLRWAQQDSHKARLALVHAGCLFWHVRRYSAKAFYEPVGVFLATLALWAYSSYTSLRAAEEGNEGRKLGKRGGAGETAGPGRRDGGRSLGVVGSLDEMGYGEGAAASSSSVQAAARHSCCQGSHTCQVHRRRTRLHSHHPSPPPSAPPSDSDSDSDSSASTPPDPKFILLDRPNDDEMVQFFVRQGHPNRMRAYITGVGHICAPTGPARILKQGRKILARLAPVWGVAAELGEVLEGVEIAVRGTRVGGGGRGISGQEAERKRG